MIILYDISIIIFFVCFFSFKGIGLSCLFVQSLKIFVLFSGIEGRFY